MKLWGSSTVRFAGAVLIAHNGKPVFAQAYGLADREHKVPNTIKTRFHIGSMNKMFTAVAIVQLAQQGKLGLDDPVKISRQTGLSPWEKRRPAYHSRKVPFPSDGQSEVGSFQ